MRPKVYYWYRSIDPSPIVPIYAYTYTYVNLYLHEKEIITLLVNFFELFASFPCTRNRNRIPNTVPVPETPNEYGSGSSTLVNTSCIPKKTVSV